MVNIEELSAKELYELAKKKEQEEARLNQLQEQIKELRGEREQLIKKHEEENAETERKIEELQARRKALSEGHKKALAILDQRLKKLEDERQQSKDTRDSAKAANAAVEQEKAKPALEKEDLPPPSEEEPEPEPAKSEAKQPKAKGMSEEEELDLLMEHLQRIMKGRSYISDSLMREKLSAAKFKSPNLSKLLDKLVKQARLVRRSGGNYVLGRVKKKK